MKKININKLELQLNKNIRHNAVSLGFDGALCKSGICLIRTDTKDLYIEKTKVIEHKEIKIITDRIDTLIKDFKKIVIPKSKYRVGVVEYPYVGLNRQTAIILALTDGAIYNAVKIKFPYTFFLSAISARARVGFHAVKRTKQQIKAGVKKQDTKKALKRYVEKIIGFKSNSDDIIDALVLALAGVLYQKGGRR